MSERFCVDCKHYRADLIELPSALVSHGCLRELRKTRDLVTGRPRVEGVHSCIAERYGERLGECSDVGRFWEPKE